MATLTEEAEKVVAEMEMGATEVEAVEALAAQVAPAMVEGTVEAEVATVEARVGTEEEAEAMAAAVAGAGTEPARPEGTEAEGAKATAAA